MIILKLLLKLFLMPIWLLLFLIWVPVHLTVMICGLFHGLGKLFFGILALLALVIGMWQNAAIFVAVIVVTFLILFAGTAVDLILEETRHQVGKVIVA